MKKKSDIMQEIERLKSVSPSEGVVAFAPLEEAIENFFTPDKEMERLVGECAYQVAYNYEYRNTAFVKQELMPTFGEDYPAGYEDVRELFAAGGVWEEMAAMQEDVFEAAFQSAAGGVSESDTSEGMTNPYLDDWAARVSAARAAINPALEEINAFCEGNATNLGLAVYFERHGGIASAPEREETAERVFVTGGYAEVIRAYGLDVHIPSYIGE